MRRNRVFQCVATAAVLSVFLTANFAAARDNDDKKDRSNQSGRSSSSSSNSSSGSSSSRSVSSSNDSSQSFSSRSSQSIQTPNTDRSTRSFGNGNGNGGATFSGSSSRASDSNSSTTRSSGSQTVARPIDGAISNGNGGNIGTAFQGFSRGNASGCNTGNSDNNSPRTFSSGSNNSSLFNRLSDNSPNALQNDRSSDNNSNSRNGSKTGNQNRDGNTSNNGNNDSNTGKRAFNGQNNQSGNTQLPGNALGNDKTDNRFGRSQSNQPGNQSNTLGPGSKLTKEKVDDFLQLRRDSTTNSLNGADDRNVGGKFIRNGKLGNDGPSPFKSGQLGSQKPLADSKNDADQAWFKRFGKTDDVPGKKSTGEKNDWRNGTVNLHGNNPNSPDRKFDKAYIDRNYQDWRKNASDNKLDGDADHRDWSGQWKNGERFVAADQIRDHWKKSGNGKGNGKDMPFSKDWWNGHDHYDGNWNRWDHFSDHHFHPYHWWSWCSAPRLTTWVSFGWNEPCYWDYGPGEYIYCNNGIVYVNGTWFEPAPVFYRRTLFLAQQAPVWTPVQAAQIDWLPLGVFAISRDGVADNNVLVQLAVTRDGVIGGTIFNQLTGASFPIQGMVDKQTQRAAWTYTDDMGAQIVMESSIFNLTQPAATGLIHYSPDNIQVIELVRLEDPTAGPYPRRPETVSAHDRTYIDQVKLTSGARFRRAARA